MGTQEKRKRKKTKTSVTMKEIDSICQAHAWKTRQDQGLMDTTSKNIMGLF